MKKCKKNVSSKSLGGSMENSGYLSAVSQIKVCLVPKFVVLVRHNYLLSP